MIEQAEGVEGVADDLRDGPGRDEQQHAVLALHLQVVQTHTHTHTRAQTHKQADGLLVMLRYHAVLFQIATAVARRLRGLLGQKKQKQNNANA